MRHDALPIRRVHGERLFHAGARATLVFRDEDGVTALHLDAGRPDVFLRGHRLIGWDDHPKLEDYLVRFRKALDAKSETRRLLPALETVLLRLSRQ